MTVRRTQRITVKDAGGNYNGQELDIAMTATAEEGSVLTEKDQAFLIEHVQELVSQSLNVDPPELGAYIPARTPQNAPQRIETPNTYQCATCGHPADLRVGTSKTGKPWKGLFCTVDKDHPVKWIR